MEDNQELDAALRDCFMFAVVSPIARQVASRRGWVTRRRNEWERLISELERHKEAARRKADKDFLGLHQRLSGEIEVHADDLIAGRITPEEFQRRMRKTMRPAYSQAAELGKKKARGIDAELSERDLAAVNRERYNEHKFLQGFTDDIQGKYAKLPPEKRKARIRWRSGMYADALQGEANDSFLAHLGAGVMVRWLLGPRREHCATCLHEAGQGWRKKSELRRVPGDGSTLCRTNCGCTLMTNDEVAGAPPVPPRGYEEDAG